MRIGNAIYLDHQATTPLDERVLAEMLPFFRDSFGNPHSAEHAFGWAAHRAVTEAAARVAALIGAEEDEIIFTSGATEANNLALAGLLARSNGRYRCLVGAADHKSILATARALADDGIGVTPLPVDREGRIALDELEASARSSRILLSLCLVNSEIGTIQDLASIAAIVRGHGGLLHIDAAQAPCAMDVSGLSAHADLISLSAHKMYGPKGIGALYAAREVQESLYPLIHGGRQQNNLRSGTLPTALCAGFGKAADIIAAEGAEERLRCGVLRDRLSEQLQALPCKAAKNGPSDSIRHPGNLNIRFSGVFGRDILDVLQPDLAASTGSACSSGLPEPSYVLRAIGLTAEEADSSLRFCVGRYSTRDDIDHAVGMIATALERLTQDASRQVG